MAPRSVPLNPAPARSRRSAAIAVLVATSAPWLLSACGSTAPAASSARASQATPTWQPFQLPAKRPTQYIPTTVDGRPVIQAEADNTLSLYRRRLRVEAHELGLLAFSWMVPVFNSAALGAAQTEPSDAPSAEVDSAPVRLLLAFDGDHSRLSMKDRILFDLVEAFSGEMPPYATLMYVWDPRAPVESVLPSARTDRLRKIVVNSGLMPPAAWHFHERDITRDFKKAFGEDPGPLVSVALMTGGDGSGSPIRAYYGEVKLVAPNGAPQ
jgi:hypothetical protein